MTNAITYAAENGVPWEVAGGEIVSKVMILLTFYLISIVAVLFLCTLRYTMFVICFAPCLIAILHTIPVEKGFRKAFPNDYEDGLPVYTEQDRVAIRKIKKAKQEEAEAAENEY